MTIPAVTAGSTIDPAWGNAVADEINAMSGRQFDANGGGALLTTNTSWATVSIAAGNWAIIASGTWDLSSSGSGRTFTAELWDGANVLDTAQLISSSLVQKASFSMLYHGTFSAGTVLIRARCSATGGTQLITSMSLLAIAG